MLALGGEVDQHALSLFCANAVLAAPDGVLVIDLRTLLGADAPVSEAVSKLGRRCQESEGALLVITEQDLYGWPVVELRS